MAFGVEAKRVVPDIRVASKASAAEDDVAALGDVVAGNGGVCESDMGDVERRHRVQAERLADAGLDVV